MIQILIVGDEALIIALAQTLLYTEKRRPAKLRKGHNNSGARLVKEGVWQKAKPRSFRIGVAPQMI